MTELIGACVIACIIFYAGWRAREMRAEALLNAHLKNAERISNKEKFEKTINVDIEKHGDMLYIFNEDNGTFMTQVKTADEFLDFLKLKYPGYTIMMKKSHKALFENGLE